MELVKLQYKIYYVTIATADILYESLAMYEKPNLLILIDVIYISLLSFSHI